MSPTQIRKAASVAFRTRVRAGLPDTGLVRQPLAGETPLSPEEVEVGRKYGLIPHHSARVRAFAEGAQ